MEEIVWYKARLNKHAKNVHKNKDHQCPYCSMTITISLMFKNYIENYHIKKFKCTQCKKSYGLETMLNDHD